MSDKNDTPTDGSNTNDPQGNGDNNDPMDFLRRLLGGDASNTGGTSNGFNLNDLGNFSFGFGPASGTDDNADGDSSEEDGKSGRDGGFMFMMQQMGDFISGISGSFGKEQGATINTTAARTAALRELGADPTISDGQRRAVDDAVRLADLWLNEVTTLPTGVSSTETWVPRTWVENSLPTWGRLLTPVIERMNTAGLEGLPGELSDQIGQFTESMGGIMNIMKNLTNYTFGTQLGSALAALSQEITCSSEMGIPLDTAGTAALLPDTIAQLSRDLELPQRDVFVFLAAREAAYQRLWAHVPWLAPRLLGAIQDHANGIVVDYSNIESATREFGLDPEVLSDPEKLQDAMNQMQTIELTPEIHYTHEKALERLETMLALVEGWVDVVVENAIKDRIPSTPALSEMWRRRRATASQAEEALKAQAGLELRPRRVRDAVTLWTRITDACGAEKRDSCWDHPDLLPRASDLDNPAACIDRLLDDTTDSFESDLAKLEEELMGDHDDTDTGNADSGDTSPEDGDDTGSTN